MPDMNKFINLNGVAAIRDWCNGKFISLEDAQRLFAPKIKARFSENFKNRQYSITGGGHTYSGTVPATLEVIQPIEVLDTTYTVRSVTASGESVSEEVEVGAYVGVYETELVVFEAFFNCTSNANAVITATSGIHVYTATADASGNSTVAVEFPGNYLITATVGTQTTEPVLATVSTTGEEVDVNLPRIGVEIVPWATGTDAQIVAMINAAREGTIDLQTDGEWAVGDTRQIEISGFTSGVYTFSTQTVDLVITAFGDYMNSGSVMQVDFKDALGTSTRMRNDPTNAGGYAGSIPQSTILPAIVNALPLWLYSLLLEFSVMASAGHQSTTIDTITGNKLALRSEVEIHGTTSQSVSGEGSQVPYYATASNKIKHLGTQGDAVIWWCRSPRKSDNISYCACSASGYADRFTATGVYGIAPFGCL